MTVREAIDRANALKPNQYDDDLKMTWLSELDSRIYNDIFLTHEDNPYTLVGTVTKENEIAFPYTDDATMLLAEEPYDVLYVSYIKAKIDEYNEETTRYANSAAEYNSQYQDYARYYNRKHMPISRVLPRPIPPRPPIPHDIDEHVSPTSHNPVMSCGIWEALQDKADKTEIPTQIADLDEDANHQTITQGDRNAWNGKQDALTLDTTPTAGSDNPVTSGGVKSALDMKADASDVPHALQDLNNLLISNPQENEVITYKNGLWQNKPQSGGGGGTSDYDDLTDKPQINGVTLSGNKSLSDLGIEKAAVEVIGTLTAGQTSLTLTNAAITTTSMIDIYTDTWGVNPTAVTVASGSITLTFNAQLSDVAVKAVVR